MGALLGAALLARSVIRRLMAYDLRDKVVVITGGSRGLGLVIARELVGRGARLAICARDADRLERARAELAARGGRVIALPCDVADPVQLERLVADVQRQLGPIDVLINNAGVIQVGPMEVMKLIDYQQAMATHFWGPLQLMLAVIPGMLERGGGRIVNIASIGGKLPAPHVLPYTASKFALVGLSEGMHVELAKHGIRVTTVVPGLMRTGSPAHATFKARHRAEYAWFAAGASLRLTSMQAERAARQIVDALRYGTPEVVLSVQAKLAAKLFALAPALMQRVNGLIDRLLPGPGGNETGRDRTSRAMRSILIRLTRGSDRAARRNNEL
jgi:NAD(P)-dependent dehydrogenase (short-subunit alcohol dehydrogenase family)